MSIAAYTKTCKSNRGGNSAIWITESANIASVTVTAGAITAITMEAISTFKPIDADLDSIIRSQEATGTKTNISYAHKVELGFAGLSLELNTLFDSIAEASACGIVALLKDSANGRFWLVGWNETDEAKRALYASSVPETSGGQPSDEEGGIAKLVLECESGHRDLPLDDATADTILASITE
jgi:hypothetical protein